MGQKFLMDTNVIVGYLGDMVPEQGAAFLDVLPACISVITRIELLGWYNAPQDELERLRTFVHDAQIFSLNEPIIEKTIELRQNHRIKTPDAIVAATALTYGFTLVTRNTDDFQNIEGFSLLNPWEL